MPNEQVLFLTLEEALAIQARVLERFGGEGGVRDPGLVESALYRPQTGYYADLLEMAAALFESLLINHPFVDGNKRAAFFATDVFLRLNGWAIRVEPDRAHRFLSESFARGTATYDTLLAWLPQHARPLRDTAR